MAVPYFAAFAVTKAFLAEMAEMAERGSGNVCSIYSPSAWFPFVGSAAYTAAAMGAPRLLRRAADRDARHWSDSD